MYIKQSQKLLKLQNNNGIHISKVLKLFSEGKQHDCQESKTNQTLSISPMTKVNHTNILKQLKEEEDERFKKKKNDDRWSILKLHTLKLNDGQVCSQFWDFVHSFPSKRVTSHLLGLNYQLPKLAFPGDYGALWLTSPSSDATQLRFASVI